MIRERERARKRERERERESKKGAGRQSTKRHTRTHTHRHTQAQATTDLIREKKTHRRGPCRPLLTNKETTKNERGRKGTITAFCGFCNIFFSYFRAREVWSVHTHTHTYIYIHTRREAERGEEEERNERSKEEEEAPLLPSSPFLPFFLHVVKGIKHTHTGICIMPGLLYLVLLTLPSEKLVCFEVLRSNKRLPIFN
jgi:hypothetical protein